MNILKKLILKLQLQLVHPKDERLIVIIFYIYLMGSLIYDYGEVRLPYTVGIEHIFWGLWFILFFFWGIRIGKRL